MNQDQIQNWSNTNLKDYLLFDSWKEEPAMCVLVGLDYLQHSEGLGLLLDWGVRSNLDIKEEPAMCVPVGLDYLQHSEGIGLPLDCGVRSNLDIKEEPAMCVPVGLDYLQHSEGIGLPLDCGVRSNLDINAYEEVISNMRRDVQRLRAFYINSSQTRESYTPSSYIDWALTKNFRPPWLDWAIEHKLYEPKQEANQNKTGTITPTTTYSTKWLEIQQAAILEFFSPRREVDAKKEEVILWIETKAKEFKIRDPNRIATSIFTIIKPEDHSPRKRRVAPQ